MPTTLPAVPASKNVKTHWLLGVAATLILLIGTSWVGAVESRLEARRVDNEARRLEITKLEERLDAVKVKLAEVVETNRKLVEANQTLADRINQLIEALSRNRRAPAAAESSSSPSRPALAPYPLQGG